MRRQLLASALLILSGCVSVPVVSGGENGRDRGDATRAIRIRRVVPTTPRATHSALAEHQVYARSYAVVVGINDYEQPGVPDLTSAERDATRMGGVLRALGFEVTTILGRDATRMRLAAMLADQLPLQIAENDRVLVYFAGHGQTSADGNLGYLLPADGDPHLPAATGISMADLQRWLMVNYAAKHVLFLADTCYSGLALRSRAVPVSSQAREYLTEIASEPVRLSIVAGTDRQEAHETDEGGVFTTHLVHAIEGDADSNGDGLVTGEEVFAYVQPAVQMTVFEEWGAAQVPQSARVGTGEFVFFVNVPLQGTGPAGTPQTQAGTTGPSSASDVELSRVRNLLAAPVPACHGAPWRDAEGMLLALEGRRIVAPQSATGAEFQANMREVLGDAASDVATVIDAFQRAMSQDPRCASAPAETAVMSGRALDWLAESVPRGDFPAPADVRRVWRQLEPADREEIEREFTSTVHDVLTEDMSPIECRAAVNYVRAVRVARSSLSPVGARALERLALLGPRRIEECLAEEPVRNGEMRTPPMRPGEGRLACNRGMPRSLMSWLVLPLPTRPWPEVRTTSARATYHSAVVSFTEGDVRGAAARLRLLSESANALATSGVYFAQTGAIQDARSALDAALELDPTHRRARLGLAVLDLVEGRQSEALTALQALMIEDLGVGVDAADMLLVGGIAFLEADRGAEAAALWNVASRFGRPEQAAVLLAVAGLRAHATPLSPDPTGDFPASATASTLALKSRVACSLGALQEAASLARAAVAADPDRADAHAALAEALIRMPANPYRGAQGELLQERLRALLRYQELEGIAHPSQDWSDMEVRQGQREINATGEYSQP